MEQLPPERSNRILGHATNEKPYAKPYPQPTGQQWETFFNNHNIPLLLQNATEEQMKKIKEIRWYISCGDDDFLYEGNSLLHIHFHKNEIRHEYRVKDGGHTWTYWHMELPIVLEHVSKTFMQH
ncbi:MAG: hypothetical protein LUE98_14780 [Tannerellaceae bacterium]|nr:hypothetical protein [Tannerellaceae bacterium]